MFKMCIKIPIWLQTGLRKLIGSHEKVLYLDYQSSHRAIYICQIQQAMQLKRVNFILYKLHINESNFLKLNYMLYQM